MSRMTVDATAAGRGRAHYAWVAEDGVPVFPVRLDEDRGITGRRTPDEEWQRRVGKAQELVDTWNRASGDRDDARLLAEALDALLAEDTSSFCEYCNRHAPKEFVSGELIGPLTHGDDCPRPIAEAALARFRGRT